MNEELTREALELIKRVDVRFISESVVTCMGVPVDVMIKRLATALLEEREKPKDDVWKNAPYWAKGAYIVWDDRGGQKFTRLYSSVRFTRKLPKTRTREIIVHGIRVQPRPSDAVDIEYVESALNKYAEELTKKETR